MKKLFLLFISLHSLIYTVNYFDAHPGYTGAIGVQGQITSKITKDHGSEYQYPWQAAGDSKNYVWDGVRFTKDDDFNISLDNDINYEVGFEEKHWRNILIEGTSNGIQRKVNLNSDSILNGDGYRTLKTQNLILKDTEFRLGHARLFFSDSTRNSLTLENSNLYKNVGKILTFSTSEFDLVSKSGKNKLTGWNDRIYAQVNLEINSGSELNFFYSGNINYGVSPIEFGSSINGTIDGGILKLEYSDLKFISSEDKFIFKNNSILELKGSRTSLDLKHATFNDSNIILNRNTSLKGNKFKFKDSTISLWAGAVYDLSDSEFNGTNTIKGSNNSITSFKTDVLTLNNNSTVTSEDITNINAGVLQLKNGSVLNISNKNFLIEDSILADQGEVNIKSNSTLDYKGNYISRLSTLNMNIDHGGKFKILDKGFFVLNNISGIQNTNMSIKNDGIILVDGYLSGSGTILGSGITLIEENGIITPDYSFGSYHGKLKFENTLGFNKGTYLLTLDVDSNMNELNDKIFYVDKNIDINNDMKIKLNYTGKNGRSAVDFQGKKFTVIQSDSAASQGTIIGDFSNITVIDDPNLPALLYFDVSDEQTNGNKDITLVGEVQGVNTLTNHVGNKTHNSKQVVNILPPTTTSGNQPPLSSGAQKLQSALLTMTNAQVYQNLNSLHAEPYSSHLTVGLEQNDLFLNMIIDRSLPKGKAYTGHIEEINLQNNMWFDIGYKEGKVSSEDELGNFKYSLTNVILGGDLYKEDQLILGAYGGYGKHKMREHDLVTQDFETDSYHLGGYGSYIYKDLIFTGVFGYAYGNNQSERDVVVGSESGTSKDRFDSHSIYTGIRGAYPIEIAPKTILTPNAGLSYSYLYQEEVVESGFDMADFKVDSTSADSFISSVGLNLTYDGVISSTPVRPMTFVRYEHDWSAAKDSTHDVRAGFVHTPDSMATFTGQNRGKNLVLVGIGVEVEVTPTFLIGMELSYSDDTNGEETGVGFNLEYLW